MTAAVMINKEISEGRSPLLLGCSYTAVFNCLNFPSGVVPVTKVTKKDLNDMENNYPTNEDFLYKLVKKATKDTLNFPIGVQVIGLPWQEELVMHTMKQIEIYRENN